MSAHRKSGKRILLAGKGSVEKVLIGLLSQIEEHNKGAQMHLREDIAKLYAYASEVRDDPKLFEEFLISAPLSDLKRPPKTAEQVLRAVMNLAYSPKLASARYRRLKPSWDDKMPPDEVQIDLVENGTSRRRVRIEMEPSLLGDYPLGEHPKGSEVYLMAIATVESAERLVCRIVFVDDAAGYM